MIETGSQQKRKLADFGKSKEEVYDQPLNIIINRESIISNNHLANLRAMKESKDKKIKASTPLGSIKKDGNKWGSKAALIKR
jgi:hypothetical protein